MLVVHNPVVPAVQNGAFVVVQQCDSGASTADNVVLSAEQWRALNALAVHRIDNWHIGGTNAAAVRRRGESSPVHLTGELQFEGRAARHLRLGRLALAHLKAARSSSVQRALANAPAVPSQVPLAKAPPQLTP